MRLILDGPEHLLDDLYRIAQEFRVKYAHKRPGLRHGVSWSYPLKTKKPGMLAYWNPTKTTIVARTITPELAEDLTRGTDIL